MFFLAFVFFFHPDVPFHSFILNLYTRTLFLLGMWGLSSSISASSPPLLPITMVTECVCLCLCVCLCVVCLQGDRGQPSVLRLPPAVAVGLGEKRLQGTGHRTLRGSCRPAGKVTAHHASRPFPVHWWDTCAYWGLGYARAAESVFATACLLVSRRRHFPMRKLIVWDARAPPLPNVDWKRRYGMQHGFWTTLAVRFQYFINLIYSLYILFKFNK